MTTLEQLVSPDLLRALGWTLLHSLWQGALAAAVLAVALLALRRRTAAVRYRAAAGALGALVLLSALTFGYYYGVRETPAVPAVAAGASAGQAAGPAAAAVLTMLPTAVAPAPQPTAWLATARQHFDQNLPWLVLAWSLGLLVMSLRLLGGLLYVRRLRRHRTRPLPAAWQARLGALAARAGLRRPVALLESGLVTAPLVVGHLRPLVLLPLGVVAGLPVACVEAVLAHELAHVLRRDYLVNLLQTLAETVFFYHPAVWFMGQCLRAERENCCDDLATQLVGGDPLRLARALTALAEWSQADVLAPAPRLALAATGGRGSLLGRVRRLVQGPPARPTRGESLAAVALLLGGLGLLGTGVALAAPAASASRSLLWPAAPMAWQSVFSPADTIKPAPAMATPPPPPPAPPAPPVPMTAETPPPAPPAPEALPALPPLPRRVRSGRADRSSTVVIEKDKKGRLTNLIVDGQQVDTQGPGHKKGKAGKKGEKEVRVEVIQAPGAWTSPGNFGPQDFEFELEPAQRAELLKQRAEVFKERDKLFRQRNEQFKHLNRQFKTFTFKTPNVTIDADVTERLSRDAVATARRSLRQSLQKPDLGPDERRAIEQALASLEDERASGSLRLALRGRVERGERLEAPEPPELPEAPEAPEAPEMPERADRAERTEALRERRRELQERIREAQRELSDLQRENLMGGAGPGRPPRAARARLAPPPPPPAPPASNRSTEVRDELRRDGLIGPNEKSFSFQLDDKGGRVNGRPLTPAQAEKYRRRFQPAATGKGKTKSTINISVDER